MSLNFEQKQAIVADLAAVAKGAHAAIGAEYIGLTVAEMTELRRSARDKDVYIKVVRNTLARRALQGTDFSCMTDSLTGPLLLAFSLEEPGSAARVIRDYAKQNGKLIVKLVSLGGELLAPEAIKALANLPTKEGALSQLMAVMTAPIGKLARTLAEPHAKLVRTVAAVRDQKQAV